MTDPELNELIRAGLLRRAVDEASALRGRSLPAPEPSPAYRRWERKFLAAPFAAAKRAARPPWLRFARAAAVIVLAAVLTFGALVAVNPTARAWVQRIAVQWFGEYASFSFEGGDEQTAGELGSWYPTWLPEGYELVEEFNPFGNSADLIYQNASGNMICVSYMNAGAGEFDTNSEFHTVSIVRVNGEDGYLLHAQTGDYYSSLTWMDPVHKIGFRVGGSLTDAELIRIAESMSQT